MVTTNCQPLTTVEDSGSLQKSFEGFSSKLELKARNMLVERVELTFENATAYVKAVGPGFAVAICESLTSVESPKKAFQDFKDRLRDDLIENHKIPEPVATQIAEGESSLLDALEVLGASDTIV
jgi:hypothetical protein